MNFRKFTIGFIILLVMGAVSYFSMTYLTSLKKKPEPPRVAKNIPFVTTEVVSYSNIAISIANRGRLSSNHKVDLISEVSGKILPGKVALKAGQSFVEGDLLYRVYDEEAKLALRAAKSRFLTSVANVLPDIKYDFESSYSAWSAFFSAIDLEQKLPELPKVKSEQEKIYLAGKNVFNDYFTIQSSEIRLLKHQVYAPFNGSFALVNFQEGSIANPGTRVATIIRTDLLELEVPVKVTEIKWMHIGQAVELVLANDEVAKGKVSRISDFIDPTTQSVLVYVDVPNTTKQNLYEGMYLDARFYGLTINQVMKVPRRSVFNFDEVFVVEDGKLQKERVEIVKIEQDYLYFRGLREGEIVAIELPLNASDHMQVKIQEAVKTQ